MFKQILAYIWAQIESNPTIIAATVTQIVILGGVFGYIQLSPEKHDVLISAVSGLSALWLRGKVIPTVFKDREVEKSVLHREATGTGIGTEVTMGTGTGSGARDAREESGR